MLFNSGTFLRFFAAFLLLFYCVRNNRTARNILILLASYLFYGWWDYRFLTLLLASSLLDYSVGLALDHFQLPHQRKLLISLSLSGNLLILGFFKYFDFFVISFSQVLAGLGLASHLHTLGIVLPVGISFYTFQTMSYAIDVYRRELKPTRDLVQFLAYVSFFPQLVAGPIERGKHLLPQFGETRHITFAFLQEGIWLCLWGMFKKIVLADNLAPLVEMAYNHPKPGALLVALGTLAFGFQIYCDFSGYSDIARGVARLLGFDLVWNFNLPYFATNLREFWRRWHISLSTWLRDYLYISLGGNRRGALRTLANLFATMLLGGLWHGAAWNFLAWGAWHGLGLCLHRLWRHLRSPTRQPASTLAPALARTDSGCVPLGDWQPASQPVFPSPAWPLADEELLLKRTPQRRSLPNRVFSWVVTIIFVFYGWLLFRAGSWHRILLLTRSLADLSIPPWLANYALGLAIFVSPVILIQLWQARTGDLLAPLRLRLWSRSLLQGILLVSIVVSWNKAKMPFIYFQF